MRQAMIVGGGDGGGEKNESTSRKGRKGGEGRSGKYAKDLYMMVLTMMRLITAR